MVTGTHYMRRCIDLALKGSGHVSPNPMVGAVLVYKDRIIGEGWHQQYGTAHAEVNCINSVAKEDLTYIVKSSLYVNLEPCSHYGKTPPCADLIIRNNIPHVIIGCKDPFGKVSGKGIDKLLAAGIKVEEDVLKEECRWLNRRFFVRQEMQRPYLILKWAHSADGFMAPFEGKRVMLSDPFSLLRVHKMRGEEDAILVGYQTALLDNPQLNNRYGTGKQPVRIVIDPELQLPENLTLFKSEQQTIIFNYHHNKELNNLKWIKLDRQAGIARKVVTHLADTGLNSVIIEGGSKTLSSFIDAGLWDESIVFNTPHLLRSGVPSPQLKGAVAHRQYYSDQDTIDVFYNSSIQHFLRVESGELKIESDR